MFCDNDSAEIHNVELICLRAWVKEEIHEVATSVGIVLEDIIVYLGTFFLVILLVQTCMKMLRFASCSSMLFTISSHMFVPTCRQGLSPRVHGARSISD